MMAIFPPYLRTLIVTGPAISSLRSFLAAIRYYYLEIWSLGVRSIIFVWLHAVQKLDTFTSSNVIRTSGIIVQVYKNRENQWNLLLFMKIITLDLRGPLSLVNAKSRLMYFNTYVGKLRRTRSLRWNNFLLQISSLIYWRSCWDCRSFLLVKTLMPMEISALDVKNNWEWPFRHGGVLDGRLNATPVSNKKFSLILIYG